MALPGANRLLLVSRDLASEIRRSSARSARRAAVAVADLAVQRTGLRDAAVLTALKSLASGEVVARNARETAEAALARLDDEYFTSRERGDPDPEWLQRFSLARAANAVVSTMHAWTWRRFIPLWSRAAAHDAACDAAYETHATIEDLRAVEAAVLSALE